jgi:signal transduction histidine kinase
VPHVDAKPKPSKWLHSLQAQLFLWTILPVTLVLIGLSLAGVYAHQDEMHDFVIQRDQLLARTLAGRLADALTLGDVAPDGTGLAQWLPIVDEELSARVFVIDGAGRVMAASEAGLPDNVRDEPGIPEVLSQSEGAVTVGGHLGDHSILAFSLVPGTDWRVVVHSQVAQLLGPILRFSNLGPIAAILAVGLSLIILYSGWRTIARPLQQLSQAAYEVSGGNYAQIHQPISGVAEIEELHGGLQEMVARLEAYQAGLLDYLDAVTKGQEEERARLAREVHDGPVQSLIVLSQRTEMAKHKLERGDGDGMEALLEQLRAAEVRVVEDLRRIIGALRPVYLEDLGFVPALEVLVQNATARSGAEVSLSVTGTARRLTPDVELAAYRITQEGLNNALQHGQASQITVTVRYDRDGVWLQIADDGVGFEPTAYLGGHARAGHFGLVGLSERTRHLGGSLQVNSALGRGTTITARLPDHCREVLCPG